MPDTFISITAPTDEPCFLIELMYFSHFLTVNLSGQKKSFFSICSQSQLFLFIFLLPICINAPLIFTLFPKTFLATALAATLAAVSLADALPPPL